MALNLRISDDSRNNDQGKKPPQFCDGVFLLQPLSDPRTLTQCMRFHELLAVEDGLLNYVLQHALVHKDEKQSIGALPASVAEHPDAMVYSSIGGTSCSISPSLFRFSSLLSKS